MAPPPPRQEGRLGVDRPVLSHFPAPRDGPLKFLRPLWRGEPGLALVCRGEGWVVVVVVLSMCRALHATVQPGSEAGSDDSSPEKTKVSYSDSLDMVVKAGIAFTSGPSLRGLVLR